MHYRHRPAGIGEDEFSQKARREGEASPVAGEEIVRIQRLMDALYASAASGQEVDVAGA